MHEIGLAEYEIEAWLPKLGARPIERVSHRDLSASYEMTQAHVFRLANGQYALVTELGCSCYEAGDADIELFPTEATARAKFEVWVKEHTWERF